MIEYLLTAVDKDDLIAEILKIMRKWDVKIEDLKEVLKEGDDG